MTRNYNIISDEKPDVLKVTSIDMDDKSKRKHRIVGGIFLTAVGGIAALGGFSKTIISTRKQDQKLYETATHESVKLLEDGARLATRALAWGTLYAVLGTGLFFYGFWKLSGAKDMNEFRMKMGSKLPRLSKDAAPNSRTEFDGLNDLMEYLSTWGKKSA